MKKKSEVRSRKYEVRGKRFFLASCLLLLASALAACSGGDNWYMSVINSGQTPLEISVSLEKEKFSVAAGEAKTFKLTHKYEDMKTERVFTLTSNGVSEKQSLKVDYETVIFDIAGSSCIVVADYSQQYAGKSDIKVLDILKGQKMYNLMRSAGKYVNMRIGARVGEKLPEKIKIAKGSTNPTYVRLVNVPCEIINNDYSIYTYLNNN